MNWLDIVIIIALILSLIGGLKAGLIASIFSIIGFVAGIFLAGQYYLPFANWMSIIPSETAARIIAFVIILAAVIVVATLIGKIVTWLLDKTVILGWVNHLGGAVLGVVMGTFFIAVALAVYVRFFGIPDAITGSFLASQFLDKLSGVINVLPNEFQVV